MFSCPNWPTQIMHFRDMVYLTYLTNIFKKLETTNVLLFRASRRRPEGNRPNGRPPSNDHDRSRWEGKRIIGCAACDVGERGGTDVATPRPPNRIYVPLNLRSWPMPDIYKIPWGQLCLLKDELYLSSPFRYVPSEDPKIVTFPKPGVTVDVSMGNESNSHGTLLFSIPFHNIIS